MIYYNKLKLNSSLITLLLVMSLLCSTIFKAYCSIYGSNNVNTSQQLKQLIQISEAHSQCLIQLQQQLLENQRDIDKLRGCIQNIQHHIAEIIYDQKESYKKLSQLSQNNENIPLSYDNLQKLPIVNDLKISKSYYNHKNVVDTEDSDYKTAVELVLKKKQYTQAIQAFQNFIQKYPQSNYQSNAHYWLGQLYYNQGNKHDSSYHFALVVKNYSKSSKAPDALLKIGIIMQETNQVNKAKTIYRQVEKLYPNSNASNQAKKRLLHLS